MTTTKVRPANITNEELPSDWREWLESKRDSVDRERWEVAERLMEWDADLDGHLSRKDAADALGLVTPSTVGDWIRTADRAWMLRRKREYESVCFSAWTYITRDPDPAGFVKELLEDMDAWGGRFAPVRVIRKRLAERNGDNAPDKPYRFEASVQQIDVEGQSLWLNIMPQDVAHLRRGGSVIVVVPNGSDE